jgi:hypothetical protein
VADLKAAPIVLCANEKKCSEEAYLTGITAARSSIDAWCLANGKGSVFAEGDTQNLVHLLKKAS